MVSNQPQPAPPYWHAGGGHNINININMAEAARVIQLTPRIEAANPDVSSSRLSNSKKEPGKEAGQPLASEYSNAESPEPPEINQPRVQQDQIFGEFKEQNYSSANQKAQDQADEDENLDQQIQPMSDNRIEGSQEKMEAADKSKRHQHERAEVQEESKESALAPSEAQGHVLKNIELDAIKQAAS